MEQFLHDVYDSPACFVTDCWDQAAAEQWLRPYHQRSYFNKEVEGKTSWLNNTHEKTNRSCFYKFQKCVRTMSNTQHGPNTSTSNRIVVRKESEQPHENRVTWVMRLFPMQKLFIFGKLLFSCCCDLNKANKAHLCLRSRSRPHQSGGRSGVALHTEALLSVFVRCITAPRACEAALPHRLDAQDDYPCLIFHHYFEPEASLAEQALQRAGLVALLTT